VFKTKRKSIYLWILILTIILLRLPVLHFWNDKNTGDDASLYIETAINFAEGKGYHVSVLRHIDDKELLLKYIENNGIKDKMEWMPPLYILSLSLLYLISDSAIFFLLTNVFNILLFVVFLFLFIQFIRKIFPNDFSVLFFSVLIIGLNFVIFKFTFGAHIEALYILTFFIAFLSHIKFVKNKRSGFVNYLLYSFALSIFLLSKYSAIPFAAAFLFHHLFRKDYKSFFIISILTFLFVSPWMFVRSYLISGHPLAQLIRGDFPFQNIEGWSGFGSESFHLIYTYFREIAHILSSYLSLDLFFFLVPFVLFFLLRKNKGNNYIKDTILILFIFSFCFFALIYNFGGTRYYVLILLPVIPFATQELLAYLRKNKQFINNQVFLIILLILYGSVQLFKITEFYNVVRKTGIERSEIINNSLDLVSKAQIEPNDVLLVNIEGFNVFSENRVVLTPMNINQENKSELIEIYGIDYVLFAEGERYLPNNIFLDQDLIGVSEERENIYLYKVVKQTN